ncbi:MAG: nitroreductase family protein [Candidatus Promineifilaceae bacterium]|jgi:nitroreductase
MDLKCVDKLLTTTRSVRRRLDFERPVEAEIIRECLQIAIQAPTGGNAQGWRFMVVTDAQKKARISELYQESFLIYARSREEQSAAAGDQRQRDQEQSARVAKSAVYLARHMGEVPVMIIPCIDGRVEERGAMAQASLYGSILPATWSLILALRARGLGSAYTTLHLRYESEIAELLGIPSIITQAALLPVAYFSGEDFKPAKRIPAAELTYWDEWGTVASNQ